MMILKHTAVHIDLTGEAKLASFKNTLFLSYAVGSGDNDAANGIGSGRKEFRHANNESSLVGDMVPQPAASSWPMPFRPASAGESA